MGFLDIVVLKLDKNGNYLWEKQNSCFNTIEYNFAPSICCDNTGIYVSYMTVGTVSGGSNVGNADIVVFKLSTNGDFLWSKQNNNFNTSENDIIPSICCNNTGIYISYFTPITQNNNNIVIFKLDKNGNFIWKKQDDAFNASDDNIFSSICCNSKGDIFVTYQTTGAISGGTNMGENDIVVFKLEQQEIKKTWWENRPWKRGNTRWSHVAPPMPPV
jgi:hypothetical protein